MKIAYAPVVSVLLMGGLVWADGIQVSAEADALGKYVNVHPTDIKPVIDLLVARENVDTTRLPAEIVTTANTLLAQYQKNSLPIFGQGLVSQGHYLLANVVLTEHTKVLRNTRAEISGDLFKDFRFLYDMLLAEIAVPQVELLEIHYPSGEWQAEYMAYQRAMDLVMWMLSKKMATGDILPDFQEWKNRIDYLAGISEIPSTENSGVDVTGRLVVNGIPSGPGILVALSNPRKGMLGSGGYNSYLNGLRQVSHWDIQEFPNTGFYLARTEETAGFKFSKVAAGTYELIVFARQQATEELQDVSIKIPSQTISAAEDKIAIAQGETLHHLGDVTLSIIRRQPYYAAAESLPVLNVETYTPAVTYYKGQKVSSLIAVKNMGKAPLQITGVSTSCSCEKLHQPREKIPIVFPLTLAPGDSTAWEMEIDTLTTLRAGSKYQSFSIASNDPLQPDYMERIRYAIVPFATPAPPYLRIVLNETAQSGPEKVRLEGAPKLELERIEPVDPSSPTTGLHFDIDTDKKGFTVTADSNAKVGNTYVSLIFSDTSIPPVKYCIALDTQETPLIRPSKLILGQVSRGTRIKRTFRLLGSWEKPPSLAASSKAGQVDDLAVSVSQGEFELSFRVAGAAGEDVIIINSGDDPSWHAEVPVTWKLQDVLK